MYVRMIRDMAISLYTSRIILKTQGVEVYGIYNVVGGVIAMFSFLNNSMSTATQRFITFELGKQNNSVNKIFSTTLLIHFIIAIVILVLAESIGLWFLNNKLNIPSSRLFAANIIFHCTIITFCINISQTPYNAMLIAHEKMNIYSYISILEITLKLINVYILYTVKTDKLILYSILTLITQITITLIYKFYCVRNYPESRFKYSFEKSLFKEITSFAGWNLFGSISWVLRDQGVNILLNIFFGPVVNEARGISAQASGAIMGFISNFQVAINPQITKSYACKEIENMEKLTFKALKYSYFLLLVISLPVMLNINYILRLWLGEYPAHSDIFIILILADALAGNIFGTPLMTSISATGKIRRYQVAVSTIILLVVPVSYICYKLDYPVYSAYIVFIIFNLFSGILRFYYAHTLVGFSYGRFIKTTIYPIIKVSAFAVITAYIIKRLNIDDTLFRVSVSIISTILITLINIAVTGLDKEERGWIYNSIKTRISHYYAKSNM